MGILNGKNKLRQKLSNGLYLRHPQRYAIYVDGELMRYRGMTTENLTRHDAEEAVAQESFMYMLNRIRDIAALLGSDACETHVFMDGKRVANKTCDRQAYPLNAQLVRSVFMTYCSQHGCQIHDLAEGESELQMYKQRNRAHNLNVFLTNDSDMMSICYGHRATVRHKNNPDYQFSCSVDIEYQQPTDEHNIRDNNCIYRAQYLDVTDSCLWTDCSSGGVKMEAFGFDASEHRCRYTPRVWRIFCGALGTDFTSALFTDSMVDGVLQAAAADVTFVNGLSDINEVLACLTVLSLRCNCSLKRFDAKALQPHQSYAFAGDDVEHMMRIYCEYIEEGVMSKEGIVRPNMSLVCRHYLYAMRSQNANFTRGMVCEWARKVTLEKALDQLRRHLGTFSERAARLQHVSTMSGAPRRVLSAKTAANRSPSPAKKESAAHGQC